MNRAADDPRESLVCTWFDPRRCHALATHVHKVYGELCPKHAVAVLSLHPKQKLREI